MRTELGRKLSTQLYGALETVVVKGTDRLPFVKPDVNDIVARVDTLSRHTLKLNVPVDFFDSRLQMDVLDWVAKEHTRKAQLVAMGSGASSGTIGLPGLAIDAPILVATTVGLVRRHALIYGFTEIEDQRGEAMPLLMALGASVGAEFAIDRLTPRFAEKIGVDVGTALVERFLMKRISEQLAAKIIVSWLPRAVPIIGAATSAALNYGFLSVIGRQSSRHYREQHTLVRRQLQSSDADLASILAERQRHQSPPNEIVIDLE